MIPTKLIKYLRHHFRNLVFLTFLDSEDKEYIEIYKGKTRIGTIEKEDKFDYWSVYDNDDRDVDGDNYIFADDWEEEFKWDWLKEHNVCSKGANGEQGERGEV